MSNHPLPEVSFRQLDTEALADAWETCLRHFGTPISADDAFTLAMYTLTILEIIERRRPPAPFTPITAERTVKRPSRPAVKS